jgi:acyl-CoA synthetase (AMP-forming)/AMP-acid ligase II
MMNIGRVFERTVDRVPERIGLVDWNGEVSYTYQEWYDRAAAIATGLAADGIKVGSRVATVTRNRSELGACPRNIGREIRFYGFRVHMT